MYKKHLLSNLEREITLLKQLATHIEAKDLDFRPAEKMRSTYELMQYLSAAGSFVLRWFIDNDITPEVRQKLTETRASLTLENFPARIDEQWKVIKGYIEPLTEEELITREVELPWKEKMPLGQAIINCPIKWLAAYRMELFMNLKMSGKSELATKDAWVIQVPVTA
jgi:hypothetical protein